MLSFLRYGRYYLTGMPLKNLPLFHDSLLPAEGGKFRLRLRAHTGIERNPLPLRKLPPENPFFLNTMGRDYMVEPHVSRKERRMLARSGNRFLGVLGKINGTQY